MSGYEETSADVLASWVAAHDNGDETHVQVTKLRDARYAALVAEFDEHGNPLNTDTIDVTLSKPEAKKRARAWMDSNPKGIQKESVLDRLGGDN